MLVDTLIAIGAFIVAISLLVAVHEWGHYIAARMSKVRVLEYSIGFGPAIWRRKAGVDRTEYQLRALPVGGYVRLLDEREGPVAEEELHRSFNRRPYWQRIFVLAAGPGMNFLFAIVAYWVIFMVGIQAAAPLVGGVTPGSVAEQAGVRAGDRIVAVEDRESPTWQAAAMAIVDQILGDPSVQVTVQDEQGARRDLLLDLSEQKKGILEDGNLFAAAGFEPMTDSRPILGDILPDGPAAAAGFESGDRILSAGGEDVGTWRQWVDYVRARPGESVPVTVDRNGTEQRLYLRIGSRSEAAGQDAAGPAAIGFVGVTQSPEARSHLFVTQRLGPLQALARGAQETGRITGLTFRVLGNMFTGDVSLRTLNGPVGIARYAGEAVQISGVAFLMFLALVSVSLGILNLLPIPILDGGQIVNQTIEKLRGRPIRERTQLAVQRLGLALVLAIMFVALFNDISGFFRP
ncbi:MAG: RIP metalloprotease RseP [Gammaproteobacteria bacterium]|nr:RIP metalloprotease RseP [Gammaproteobacteria bacterium]MYF67482.1 RIP metalloprotease RseP [Gammaproteobacteria bacterium]MYK37412.1 RIP metalloprotease RseP [Gammaproteobacteria bacterium]